MTPRGPILLAELGSFGIIRMLGLFLGIEVVEIAEEFVEAVVGGQMLVEVAQVIFAELAGHVALGLEQLGHRQVFLLQAFLGARQADLEQPRSERRLAGDERRAAGRAALLAIPVREQRSFFGDAVDVGRLVAHHAAVVGADVPVADVVAPDDEDVGFLLRCQRGAAMNATASNTASLILLASLFIAPPLH